MPWPISLYQGPFSLPMSMPAALQRSSSAIWVPERSPREMKGAPLDLMVFKASATSVMPLMPAGSLFGPIRTKSLYIPGYRLTPKPSATNFSSCALACTNSTSASPRRPVSSAWPVPCATTFTSMPVLALNSGRMWEQAGVLRRRGGGDHNGFVLRAGGCGGDERDGGRQNDQATAGRHDVLLLVRVSRD